MAAEPGDLIKAISADVQTIVRSEIALAKSELIPSGKNAGIGAGLFGAAGYTGINAVSLLFMAGGFGFGALFEVLLKWPITGACALGFVIMAVLLLVITAILALIGKGRFAKVKGPERAQAQAELTVDESKAAIARGVEDVKSGRALEEYKADKEHLVSTTLVPTAATATTPNTTTVTPGSAEGYASSPFSGGATRADVPQDRQ